MRRDSYCSEGRQAVPNGNLVVVCVDDTDDITRSTSTGAIASAMAKAAVGLGGVLRLDVTRHQLLLRDDVPYTSHNSAMAFEVWLEDDLVQVFRERAISIITQQKARVSDPGLCIVRTGIAPGSNDGFDRIKPFSSLVSFGNKAKVEFCSVEEAFTLAKSLPGVQLSAHGGTGSGVVGALAGAGLRIGGQDGRFRGKWSLTAPEGGLPVGQAVSQLGAKLGGGPVRFVDVGGGVLPDDILILGECSDIKPVLAKGSFTVVCETSAAGARPCGKNDLGNIGNAEKPGDFPCELFEWDNDLNECVDGCPSCRNCLYRRWRQNGFTCEKGIAPMRA